MSMDNDQKTFRPTDDGRRELISQERREPDLDVRGHESILLDH